MDNPETASIQPTETTETQLVSTPKSSNQWLKIVLLGVVGVIIASGLVFAGYKLGQKEEQTKLPQPTPASFPTLASTPTPMPEISSTIVVTPPSESTPTLEPTANWKTYLSPKADYSFKYPTEWPLVNVPIFPQCTVCVEDIVFTPKYSANTGDNNLAVILVFKEDRIKTLEDYLNVHVKGDPSKINLTYTTVGGERAVSYTLSGGIPPLPVIEYAVVKNEMYYTIRLEDSTETNKNKDKNLVLFDQILSTFKFLD